MESGMETKEKQWREECSELDYGKDEYFVAGYLTARRQAQVEIETVCDGFKVLLKIRDEEIQKLREQLKLNTDRLFKYTDSPEAIQELKQELQKVYECVAFYANEEQWVTANYGVANFCKMDEDSEKMGSQSFAGKFARETIKNRKVL
jgi:hypothetical protein